MEQEMEIKMFRVHGSGPLHYAGHLMMTKPRKTLNPKASIVNPKTASKASSGEVAKKSADDTTCTYTE